MLTFEKWTYSMWRQPFDDNKKKGKHFIFVGNCMLLVTSAICKLKRTFWALKLVKKGKCLLSNKCCPLLDTSSTSLLARLTSLSWYYSNKWWDLAWETIRWTLGGDRTFPGRCAQVHKLSASVWSIILKWRASELDVWMWTRMGVSAHHVNTKNSFTKSLQFLVNLGDDM